MSREKKGLITRLRSNISRLVNMDKDDLIRAINTPARISIFATFLSVIVASVLFLLIETAFNDNIAIILTVTMTAAPISYFISKVAFAYQKTIIQQRTLLEEQSKELRAAKEVAEAASKAKSEFLSTMSHEMRTPLNAVIGMTNIMISDRPAPEQLEQLKILKFSAESLLAMVNDILDFNKIEAGKIELEAVDYNLHDLIIGIKHSWTARAEEKNIQLIFRQSTDLPEKIEGDSVRLGQILNNLIGNAVKFTEKGSVTVDINKIKETDKNVTISYAVKDTGIGIPSEKMDQIFKTFVQASSDTTRKFGGTGLGLAIAKSLIEAHKSKITVESKIGKGSVFSFELECKKGKIASPNSKAPESNEVQRGKSLDGLKVLIVEDDAVNVLVAESFLKRWNAKTGHAENGAVAVEKIKDKSYDIVLMDLQMPEMDGYQATKKIRELEGDYFKELPIIALTAGATVDVREEVMEEGMTDFMTKPFNPDKLFEVLLKHGIDHREKNKRTA